MRLLRPLLTQMDTLQHAKKWGIITKYCSVNFTDEQRRIQICAVNSFLGRTVPTIGMCRIRICIFSRLCSFESTIGNAFRARTSTKSKNRKMEKKWSWGSVTFWCGSGSAPLTCGSRSNSRYDSFLQHYLQSEKSNFLLKFCFKILFSRIISVRSTALWEKGRIREAQKHEDPAVPDSQHWM